MKQVIAFVGRAGSGKDYQCGLLVEKGYKRLAFADALRDIAFNCLGISPEVGETLYEGLKANDCIYVDLHCVNSMFDSHNLNFRQFLERLGTQGIRKYCDDFWVQALINTIKSTPENICISDLRFPNEYIMLHDYCMDNNIDFKCYFCDYHSPRYQENNPHESAKMSNWLCEQGKQDLTPVTLLEIQQYLSNT